MKKPIAKTVLIVDDELQSQEQISNQLKEMGFSDIMLAGDGEEALELIAKEKIDLVISDWELPKRDGLELFEAIQKKSGDIPFILLTAKKKKEDILEARTRGIKNYVTKPYDVENLSSKIQRTLKLKED